MLGTIAELGDFYVPPEGAQSVSEGVIDIVRDMSALGGWNLTDFMSLYGASSSTQDLISLITGPGTLMRAREEAAEAGREYTPPLESDMANGELMKAMLKSNLNASDLPPVHSSWGQQKFNVADEGFLPIGRIVYVALRIGLLARANPFPDRIAAVVVAANVESFKYGSWTSKASSAARKATVDEGKGDGAWDDDNRVYVLLPRQCFLGPGATGDVACAAYGVGWVRDGKLENYADLLSGRDEVLGSTVTMAPIGLVTMLLVATIFMVDKGSQLGLAGWSGVLSVVAQYRADDIYSSRGATRAVLAVRSGRANFASVRDLVTSTVPTVWYPLLALGAETSGRNVGWGSGTCAAAVGILLFSHGLKLKSHGVSELQVLLKRMVMVLFVGMSPLLYRLAYYTAFTSSINLIFYRLVTGSFSGIPDFGLTSIRLFYVCVMVGSVVELSIIASDHGWDPAPSTTPTRLRWIVSGLFSVCSAYSAGDFLRGGNVLHDPKPYALSGWSHVHGGSNKASRYIVEYGLGEGVYTDGDHERNDYYAIWRG